MWEAKKILNKIFHSKNIQSTKESKNHATVKIYFFKDKRILLLRVENLICFYNNFWFKIGFFK
jgi:hypothetical protein